MQHSSIFSIFSILLGSNLSFARSQSDDPFLNSNIGVEFDDFFEDAADPFNNVVASTNCDATQQSLVTNDEFSLFSRGTDGSSCDPGLSLPPDVLQIFENPLQSIEDSLPGSLTTEQEQKKEDPCAEFAFWGYNRPLCCEYAIKYAPNLSTEPVDPLEDYYTVFECYRALMMKNISMSRKLIEFIVLIDGICTFRFDVCCRGWVSVSKVFIQILPH